MKFTKKIKITTNQIYIPLTLKDLIKSDGYELEDAVLEYEVDGKVVINFGKKDK